MEDNVVKYLLPFKTQQLLNTIIEKRGLCVEDAVHYLYSSNVYKQLSEESSLLWQFSTLYLYDMLMSEKRLKKQRQNNTKPILLFVTFCIENYKEYKNISADETLFIFNKYEVIGYLEAVYDTLHTQGKDYIMSEIDGYIKNRKAKK
jgi:hypothetical protein